MTGQAGGGVQRKLWTGPWLVFGPSTFWEWPKQEDPCLPLHNQTSAAAAGIVGSAERYVSLSATTGSTALTPAGKSCSHWPFLQCPGLPAAPGESPQAHWGWGQESKVCAFTDQLHGCAHLRPWSRSCCLASSVAQPGCRVHFPNLLPL